MIEVHVIPDQRGAWRVYDSDTAPPLSEHTSATEAELAARARAGERNADQVVVHDRYHRAHDEASSPAGDAAQQQDACARQLALVRELARTRPR